MGVGLSAARAREGIELPTDDDNTYLVADAVTVTVAPTDLRRGAPSCDDNLLRQALDRPSRPPQWLVRGFDLTVATVMLILTLPVLAAAALAVRFADGSPVLFAQERIGRHGRPFKVLKFRTMVRDADVRLAELLASDPVAAEEFRTARKLQHDPRLHRFGSVMRRLKIDELPQLFNVIRGDMSIVGPRPVLADEVVRYGAYGQIVFSLRPGLTGPWQVGSTDVGNYEERVELDVAFAQSHSFFRMVHLALATPFVIVASMKKKEFV